MNLDFRYGSIEIDKKKVVTLININDDFFYRLLPITIESYR